MVWVFWLSVAAVVYVYAGYPLLLRVWARLRPKPIARAPINHQINHQSSIVNHQFPAISIVIAARNEAARLPARIDNLLSLDYPADRRQIIVVSDGSTDDTLGALARYRGVVDVVAVPAGGKALALNAGVAAARHEILVYADARQVFAPDALRELVAPFADPQVGAVTGELLLDAESPCRRSGRDRRTWERRAGLRADAADRRTEDRRLMIRSTIADGIGLYWKYEKELRRLESAIGSTLGATGAIYAMRRSLFRPLPADTILDDVLTPMRVVLAGHRVVFTDRAHAYDRAAADADAEARRKVRTLAGNYQILALEPRLLVPFVNPTWLQYLSHKLGRLAVPYAVLATFVANIVLSGSHLFYALTLAAQVAFYLLAGIGAVLEFGARRREDIAIARSAGAPVGAVAREIA
ncbi:MAG TPA: glycosyltransferase family 2 protein [Vicinamibacterales bacterium]|nr:glycosyltransferase family 2 protein [Vicinamibacterales bacterium]